MVIQVNYPRLKAGEWEFEGEHLAQDPHQPHDDLRSMLPFLESRMGACDAGSPWYHDGASSTLEFCDVHAQIRELGSQPHRSPFVVVGQGANRVELVEIMNWLRRSNYSDRLWTYPEGMGLFIERSPIPGGDLLAEHSHRWTFGKTYHGEI